MKTMLLAGVTAVLLTGCTSISVTETYDNKENYVAVVKVSKFATDDVTKFLDEAKRKITTVCTHLRPAELASGVAEAKAWLELVARARGLLATHEFMSTCVLIAASNEESDDSGQGQ